MILQSLSLVHRVLAKADLLLLTLHVLDLLVHDGDAELVVLWSAAHQGRVDFGSQIARCHRLLFKLGRALLSQLVNGVAVLVVYNVVDGVTGAHVSGLPLFNRMARAYNYSLLGGVLRLDIFVQAHQAGGVERRTGASHEMVRGRTRRVGRIVRVRVDRARLSLVLVARLVHLKLKAVQRVVGQLLIQTVHLIHREVVEIPFKVLPRASASHLIRSLKLTPRVELGLLLHDETA